MSANYVPIYQCQTEPESAFIQGLMEDAGLRIAVHGSDIATLDLVPAPIRILVHPEDLRQAELILDQHENQGETAAVACPRCKSTNDAHFALCWNCGKEI